MVLRNLHYVLPNVSTASNQHVRKYHGKTDVFGDGDPRKARLQRILGKKLPKRPHVVMRKDVIINPKPKYFVLPRPSIPPKFQTFSFPDPGGRFKGSGRHGLQGLH